MSDDLTTWLRGEIRGDLGSARHILDVRGARPDPRREMHDAIADCEAKLAILDEHEPSEIAPDACRCCKGSLAYPCRTVRLIGYGCRHRPGYREELWKP